MGIGIKRDIEELVKHDVIDEETARRINEYYALKKDHFNVTALFSILAAFFIGIGIISIISYNWDNLPVAVRSVLSLVPLGLASYGSYYVLRHKMASVSWRESIAIFQALAFAASFALICQTFQIQSGSDAFIYACLLTAVPFMFIFRSAGLSLIIIAATCCEVMTGIDYLWWSMLLISNAVFVYLYYVKEKEALLFKLRVALLPITILAVVYGYTMELRNPVPMFCVLASVYYSLHMLIEQRMRRSRGMLLALFSYVMLFGVLLVCSIDHALDLQYWWKSIIPVAVISVAQISWIVFRLMSKQAVKWQEWVGFVALGGIMTDSSVVVLILTLLIAGYAIYDSVCSYDVIELNVGILALFIWALIVLKSYDLPFFDNGIIFILLGVVLIIMNRYMNKRHKTNKGIGNE